MSELFKQVLAITVISFSFVGEIYAQQGGGYGDSFPFSTLPGREFRLDYNPTLMPDLNPGLMMPDRLKNRSMLPDISLQYQKPSYEIWHRPIYNEMNISGRLLNSNIIAYPLLGKNAFYLSGTQDFMPGISSMNSMTAGLMIQPVDNWIIDISGSAVKYQDFIGIHNDFTFNASTHFSLSDNLIINIFGGYSINALRNVVEGFDTRSPFAPVSYFGGTLEYRFTDGFSLEGGYETGV